MPTLHRANPRHYDAIKMESNGVKPKVEAYDIGGLDNPMLLMNQEISFEPMNFNFVWSVAVVVEGEA